MLYPFELRALANVFISQFTSIGCSRRRTEPVPASKALAGWRIAFDWSAVRMGMNHEEPRRRQSSTLGKRAMIGTSAGRSSHPVLTSFAQAFALEFEAVIGGLVLIHLCNVNCFQIHPDS